ncbi:MAG TPA: DNA repair protein RecN [Bacillota bacterium]
MLRELTIKNLALIEELRLEFTEGLNILTGETGAGKSIIIDAVSLALGVRSSAEMVRAEAESAQVEAVFELEENADLDRALAEWGIPMGEDRILVINREVQLAGRSRCRVNGQTVPVLTLSKIGGFLLDLHGQHEHQSLLHIDKHREILDSFGGAELNEQKKATAAAYQRWAELKRELDRLSLNEQEKKERLDYLNFQLQEIDRARLQPGEEEELLKEREVLAAAEALFAAASTAYELLYGGEEPGSALDKLTAGEQVLAKVIEVDPRLKPFHQTITEAACQLEETARDLRAYRDQVEFDPARLAAVEERLDEITRLKRKYGMEVPEIMAYAEKARKELESIESQEEMLAAKAKELAVVEEELRDRAQALSELRRKAAAVLEETVISQLAQVNMGKTVFKVSISQVPDEKGGLPVNGSKLAINETGFDRVEFLVAPNPGEGLRPLAKIASGGELSRMMLVLKVIMAKAGSIPTMVFDEIDAGISGRTAQAVAEKLLLLAQTNQVICVTHLPQIASMATQHLYIEKYTSGERTRVQVRVLSKEGRIEEMARMLGGAVVTDTTRNHAEEMLIQAEALRRKACQH